MPKKIVPLSDAQIRTYKALDKPTNLFDGGGLFVHVPAKRYTKDGKPLPDSKLWRFKYRFAGKPRLMAFGAYPDISLKKARELHQEARSLLAEGIDPQEEKQRHKAANQQKKEIQENTFASVAMQWYNVAKTEWAPGHARTVLSRIQRDILPPLGSKLISEITTKDVLAALRIVEARQAFETAHRIKTIIGQIFTFALVSDTPGVTSNPAMGLSKVLKRPVKKNMAAILDPEVLGRLLRDLEVYAGSYVVRCALQLAPMLFVRPGELRNAKWKDIDLDGAEWNIPMEDMKLTVREKAERKGQVHTVPLSKQAVSILLELYLFTGRSQYVFPGRAASRVMSENTITQALRTMGWDGETVTGHGFRATARTMLHETLGFSPDAIEAQLGHRVPDRLGAAYNRSKHLDERRKMMQAWADFLDRLKAGAV